MIKKNDGTPESSPSAMTASIDQTTLTSSKLLNELHMQSEIFKRIQVELKVARDNFRELYDSAPVSYLTVDFDGFILMNNFAASELLGLNRENLLHTPFSQFVAVADRDKWKRIFLGALRNDQQKCCDIKLQR